MSLSALRRICLTNPDKGGFSISHVNSSVMYNWRFNHGMGPRVSKRMATHMEPLALDGGVNRDGPFAYYSIGDSNEARRCLHFLIAENYAFGSPLVFHDVVPSSEDRSRPTVYRFYLDLETSDPAILGAESSSTVLAPLSIVKALVPAMQSLVGNGKDSKLTETLAFDASRVGSKFSMHVIFPHLVQDRYAHARLQADLISILEKGDASARVVAQLIDRASHSSQPKLRMPFCDKIAGVSTGGATVCAGRTLEYAGEFTANGDYKDFSSDAVEAVIDLRRGMVQRARDAESEDDASGDDDASDADNDDLIGEMAALAKTAFPWSFWLIPSRLLPKQARVARMCLAQHVSGTPSHPDAAKLVSILDRACLVPAAEEASEAGGGYGVACGEVSRDDVYSSYCKQFAASRNV